MVKVSAWGRVGEWEHEVRPLCDRQKIIPLLKSDKPGLAFGAGRSYGDVCLNPGGVLWLTAGLDRLIDFDPDTGRLTCEAGILLRDIQRMFIPRGWGLPVTPGSQIVTVGGAVANDVHGKNHHIMGSFGDHVLRIKLIRSDGRVITCTPTEGSDWFAATLGGLGLTGVITEVDLQLRRVAGPWLETETIPYGNLDEFFDLADQSESAWEYTVSWIDCSRPGGARGIFMRGNHIPMDVPAKPPEKERVLPFVPPVSLINKLSLRPFNELYFLSQKRRAGKRIMHYEPFFYPLDGILEWNKIYGPKGFFQYQSVVSRTVGRDVTTAMLKEITRAGDGSFLAVLKTFGNRQSAGMLSFPKPGVTLALDFPNAGEHTLKVFARLDAILREAGGRIYPAKDARMPRELFESGYPRLQEFIQYRDAGIGSAMSRRLMGN